MVAGPGAGSMARASPASQLLKVLLGEAHSGENRSSTTTLEAMWVAWHVAIKEVVIQRVWVD